MSYFGNIAYTFRTIWKGMKLTMHHLVSARRGRKKEWVGDENYFSKEDRIFTVQYPSETIPVPDNGRYKLHNEIEDCIVCDKCAKICPVDCIDIEPVRAVETIRTASDGTPVKIHAAKFDIDMAKCCFCGLCTVVCPTECLTMTKEYDYSTTDILDHNFSFSKMTESEIESKKQELEDFQAQKAQKAGSVEKKPAAAKPLPKIGAKPKVAAVKPKLSKPKISESQSDEIENSSDKTVEDGARPKMTKPVIPGAKPKIKPRIPGVKPKATEEGAKEEPSESKPVSSKPKMMKPKIPGVKPKATEEKPKEETAKSEMSKKKPVHKMRPVIKKKDKDH